MRVLTLEEMLSRYILSSNEATTTLFSKELYGFGLIVLYSTIDTLGLLSAPGAVQSATRKTFEPWVAHYLLPHTDKSFNEREPPREFRRLLGLSHAALGSMACCR